MWSAVLWPDNEKVNCTGLSKIELEFLIGYILALKIPTILPCKYYVK